MSEMKLLLMQVEMVSTRPQQIRDWNQLDQDTHVTA